MSRIARDLILIGLGCMVPTWLSTVLTQATLQSVAGVASLSLVVALVVVVLIEANNARFERLFRPITDVVLDRLPRGVTRFASRHRRLTAAGVGGVFLLCVVMTSSSILSAPLIDLEKSAILCSSTSSLATTICNRHAGDYLAILITVASRNPAGSFAGATLTDSLPRGVGPKTVDDPVILSGPGGTVRRATSVMVPEGKWARYEPRTTIELTRGARSGRQLPDNLNGESNLFSGLRLEDVPRYVPVVDNQPYIQVSYLVHFIDAPSDATGVDFAVGVTRAAERGPYALQAAACAGDEVQFQVNIRNRTNNTIQNATTTVTMPATADAAPSVSAFITMDLGTKTAAAYVDCKSDEYLNYVSQSTYEISADGTQIPIPDVDGTGPLFTTDGLKSDLLPGTDIYIYYYFSARLAKRPLPASSVPAWIR